MLKSIKYTYLIPAYNVPSETSGHSKTLKFLGRYSKTYLHNYIADVIVMVKNIITYLPKTMKVQ